MDHSSFLPEDYLAQKAERRTNIICLTLFAVVMASVFGAFLVTNRQWSQVSARQETINAQYLDAGEKIRELTELERQKDAMLEKAELASALVERVPRSILFAELINRMPPRLGLTAFDLQSAKLVTKPAASGSGGVGRIGGKPDRAPTKAEAEAEAQKIEAPRYLVKIVMVGVAPTDLEVSRYIAELNAYELISDVTLEYSEEKEVEEQLVREFKLTMQLDPSADVRGLDPLIMPRDLRNPMDDQLRMLSPDGSAASAPTDRR